MSIFTSVQSWNRARNTRKALNNLSSNQLDDIGVIRNNIAAVSRNPGLLR